MTVAKGLALTVYNIHDPQHGHTILHFTRGKYFPRAMVSSLIGKCSQLSYPVPTAYIFYLLDPRYTLKTSDMTAPKIIESRTTILYMAGFGMFLILSYLLVVAPAKQQRECFMRKQTSESATESMPAQSREVNNEVPE